MAEWFKALVLKTSNVKAFVGSNPTTSVQLKSKMKSFKQLRQEVTHECYLQKEIFQEGDYIMNVNTGEKGKIIRSGVNYVIAVTESEKMFRAWVKDIREVNVVENINKERKNSSIFTNGKTTSNDPSSTL